MIITREDNNNVRSNLWELLIEYCNRAS